MRRTLCATLLATAVATGPSPAAQSPEPAAKAELKIADVVDLMNKSEAALVVRMGMYHPLVEVYIQNVVPDEQYGWTPTRDEYFLGQFDLGETPRLRPISGSSGVDCACASRRLKTSSPA